MDVKILSLIVAFLVNVLVVPKAYAQVNLTGIITESNGQPLPYASAVFLNSVDSNFAGGTLSGTDGTFSILLNSGTYILRISSLGYKVLESRITLPVGVQDFRLDTLIMNEVLNRLDAVIVKAQKPLYEKKSDRININVQSGISSAGSSVLDILAKSPGVLVNRQNGNIEINGKNGVLMMIDGKQNRLPADALVQMLEGMNSANVERIEIITAPPAKYDASGNAGIINIVLKSSADNGLNGNISTTAGYQRGPVWGVSSRIQQRKNKLNTFLNYSFRSVQTINYWKYDTKIITDHFTATDRNGSKRKPLTRLHDLRIGMEYQISGKTRAMLFLSGYQRNWDMKAVTNNRYASDTVPMQFTSMEVKEINKWNSITANLELAQKLGNAHNLVISFDYLYYMNHNPSVYYRRPSGNDQPGSQQQLMLVKKRTPIYYKVGGIDYSYQPGSHLTIESGIKGAFSEFRNKVSVVKFNPETQLDNNNSANANLDERIFAIYSSFKWNMLSDLHLHAGLRYEYTRSDFNEESQQVTRRTFSNIFPELSVTYDINKERKLQISYNRRITRPTFNDMAPFVFYVGPRTYVSGNLSLKPAVADALDLSYNIKRLWISVKFNNSKNEMAQFQPERDTASNEMILKAKNVDYLRTFSLHAVFPLKLSRWWAVQNDYAIYFHALKTREDGIDIDQTLESFVFNMVHSFDLMGKFKAEASLSYQSGSFLGISQFKSSGSVNLGIKKEFKNASVITLTANDLFNTTRWRISTQSEALDFRSDWSYDWGGRSITLGFNFPFGNHSLTETEIKPRSGAERNRVQ